MYNPVNNMKKMQLHPIKNEPNTDDDNYEPISNISLDEDNSCDKMSKIIQFPNTACIYISGVNCLLPPDFQELKENNIKTVLSIMDDLSVIIPPSYKQYFFKALDTPTEPIQNHFENTWILVSQAINSGENVLIHCRAGISRSVTLFISFILKCIQYKFPIDSYIHKEPRENWSQAILRYVQKKRVCANPNMGFMLQLYRYEQSLRIQ